MPCLQRVEDSQEPAPEGVPQHGPALSVDKHQQGLGAGRHILNAVVLPLQLGWAPPAAAPLVARTGQLQIYTTLEDPGTGMCYGVRGARPFCGTSKAHAHLKHTRSCLYLYTFILLYYMFVLLYLYNFICLYFYMFIL